MKKSIFAVTIAVISLPACVSVEAPPLIDSHTIMESEASGEWPELEKRFLKQQAKVGPIMYPREGESARKKRVFTILNGDLYTARAK